MNSLLISSGRGFDGIAYIAGQSYGYRNRKPGHQKWHADIRPNYKTKYPYRRRSKDKLLETLSYSHKSRTACTAR